MPCVEKPNVEVVFRHSKLFISFSVATIPKKNTQRDQFVEVSHLLHAAVSFKALPPPTSVESVILGHLLRSCLFWKYMVFV